MQQQPPPKDDNADYDEEYELEQQRKTCCQTYFLINPETSSFKGYWDAFIYFGLAFNYFLQPFTMAFDFASFDLPPRIMPRIKEWEIIFDICYLVHIVLTFITSFQHDLEWVETPKDIALTYVKSYFFIDVLTTIPPMIMQ